MPIQKDVVPLGSLCVECIARLMVDIIQVHHKLNEKCKKNQDANGAQENAKIKDKEKGLDNQENGQQKNQDANDAQEDAILKDGLDNQENGQLKNQDANGVQENAKLEDGLDNQENSLLKHEGQANGSAISTDNHEEKSSTGKETEIKYEYEKDLLSIESLETYIKALVSVLTSHAHVALHDKLFSTVVSKFTEMYLTKKKLRPIVQDIVPHFLNSSLRDFDFGKSRMLSEADMCQVLFDHLQNASHLNVLDIGRSCYWRLNVFEHLSSKLKHLPELTVLRIQYICTPDMISGLSESCPNLLELNLKGSEKITDEECDEISKCASLRFLDITGTRITGLGSWKVINTIKTLSWIQHCAFNCNSDSLIFKTRAQLFDCIKDHANFNDPRNIQPSELKNMLSLKNFWLFNPCSEDMFSILLCPQLEHLRLDFIFQDLQEEPDLTVLTQLPNIKKFQANLYDRCVIDLVTQMIEGFGSKLVTLDLHLADDYFYAAQVHNVVARCCPNLVTLRFTGDYKARHSLEDSDNCLDFEIEAPAHPLLENLSITGVVSDCRLRFILSHTPAIRHLYLDGELEWLHDNAFKNLLELNPLPHLEYMWFNVSTTITLSTVRLLLLNENSLHTIGRLCHMAGASKNEYQELQDLVRQRNLDVKLIWVSNELNR